MGEPHCSDKMLWVLDTRSQTRGAMGSDAQECTSKSVGNEDEECICCVGIQLFTYRSDGHSVSVLDYFCKHFLFHLGYSLECKLSAERKGLQNV